MRILWITPQLPCSIGGGQGRQLSLLRYLAGSHQVTLVTLASPEEQEHTAEADRYCKHLTVVPYTRPRGQPRWRDRLAAWKQLLLDVKPHYARTYPLENLLPEVRRALASDRYDLVHLEHLFVAPLREAVDCIPSLLACQNVEHSIARQQIVLAGHFFRRIYALIEWFKLRRFEHHWVRRFDTLTAISSADAALLQKIAPRLSVHVVPHGVDAASFTPPDGPGGQRRGLLFVGTLSYRPNSDGVLYFCREIWPIIHGEEPYVHLTIVGADPPPEVQELTSVPGITVTGYVPDVRPFFWEAALSIVPLRAGGGVRIKILESLAAACPVVSTPAGAAGTELGPADGLLSAHSPQEFAQQVLTLLRDPARRQALGQSGQRAIAARHDWKCVGSQLEKAYEATLSRPRTPLSS